MWLRVYALLVTAVCLGLLGERFLLPKRPVLVSPNAPALTPAAAVLPPQQNSTRPIDTVLAAEEAPTPLLRADTSSRIVADNTSDEILLRAAHADIGRAAQWTLQDLERYITLTLEERAKLLDYFNVQQKIGLLQTSGIISAEEAESRYEEAGTLADILGRERAALVETLRDEIIDQSELVEVDAQLAYYSELLELNERQKEVLRSALHQPWDERDRHTQAAYLTQLLSLTVEQRKLVEETLGEAYEIFEKSVERESEETEAAALTADPQPDSPGGIADELLRRRLAPLLTEAQMQRLITYQSSRWL